VPHHVTQRGNTHLDVFFVDDDYRAYRELLCQLAELDRVEIHGCCLTANHLQLIATPASAHPDGDGRTDAPRPLSQHLWTEKLRR